MFNGCAAANGGGDATGNIAGTVLVPPIVTAAVANFSFDRLNTGTSYAEQLVGGSFTAQFCLRDRSERTFPYVAVSLVDDQLVSGSAIDCTRLIDRIIAHVPFISIAGIGRAVVVTWKRGSEVVKKVLQYRKRRSRL